MAGEGERKRNDSMVASSMRVEVEHQGVHFSGQLLAVHRRGGVVATGMDLQPGSVVLCHLIPEPDKGPALVIESEVMSAVVDAPTETDTEAYLVRWSWAHCGDGPGDLRVRLRTLLGVPEEDLSIKRLHALSQGAYLYALHDDAQDKLRRLAERLRREQAVRADAGHVDGEAPEDLAKTTQLRSHQRVGVDIPCAYPLEGEERAGYVRNLSREGVFVISGDDLPSAGTELSLAIPMNYDDQPGTVTLKGTVLWCDAEEGRDAAGGFGFRVSEVVDGMGGRMYDAFVDQVLGRHYAGFDEPHAVAIVPGTIDAEVYDRAAGD